MVRDAKRIELEQEIRRLESQVEISTEQLAAFEKEVEKKGQRSRRPWAAVRSTHKWRGPRSRTSNASCTAWPKSGNASAWNSTSQHRVEVLGDPNRLPPFRKAKPAIFRYLFIIFGSVLAMLVPAVGIVVWDLRKERINSANDVSKRLKIPVIGAVPLIPATVMRRLGDATRKSQIWKMRFTESVDGVAARLLRKAECDQTRVVLITSAHERRRQDHLGHPTGHEPGPRPAENRPGGLRLAAAHAGRGPGTSAGTGNLRGPPRPRRDHGHGPANRNRVPLRGHGRLLESPGAGGSQQRHRGHGAWSNSARTSIS